MTAIFTAKGTSLRESTSFELFCVKIGWGCSHHGGAGNAKSKRGVGRYVGFTPMRERTICGFRAGRRGCAASLLCRHINVIKNSDFYSSRATFLT